MFHLDTARLVLRDLEENDVVFIRRLACEPTIRRYQSLLRLESEQAIQEFVHAAVSHNNLIPRRGFNLVIEERRLEQAIGWIGWGQSADSICGSFGVGYALLPQYWGKGYMTEALCAGLTFMFEELKAECVSDYCETSNVGSARVMAKQGMKLIARWSGQASDGSSTEYSRYSIKKSEWLLLTSQRQGR